VATIAKPRNQIYLSSGDDIVPLDITLDDLLAGDELIPGFSR